MVHMVYGFNFMLDVFLKLYESSSFGKKGRKLKYMSEMKEDWILS